MIKRREVIALICSAAAVWPLGLLAQMPSRRPLVAILHGQSSAATSHYERAFAQRMQELGYAAGRDVEVI